MESTPEVPSRFTRLRAWAKVQQVRGQALADRAQREREHHASIDTAFEMAERDGDTGGGIIAGALAYRLFIWLLPLALVLIAGLGFASDAASQSPEDAAASFGLAGLISSSVASAAEGSGRWYALFIGIPILVYVTRGLLRALIGAHRLIWGEPRSPKLKPTIRATLILLALLMAYFVVLALVNWARTTSTSLGLLGTALAFLAYAAVWLFISLRLPHRDAAWEALIPGALVFAFGLISIQVAAFYVLTPYVLNKGGTYGSLGIAAGLLFSLYLIGRAIIFGAVVNATLWERNLVLGR